MMMSSSSTSSSLPLKFAFLFSLSLAGAAATISTKPKHHKPTLSFSSSTPQTQSRRPKATPSDLLSVLGSPHQARSVDPIVAQELRSCFRFLVPFTFTPPIIIEHPTVINRRRSLNSGSGRVLISAKTQSRIDELILSPPPPVLELARLSVDSGGDPGAIHRILDPTVLPVPDVEGSNEHRCELTRTPYGRRFINEELNSYIKSLFEIIVKRGPRVGLNVSLDRYDFFHGHLFLATESGRLGILFHAKEYPAYDKDVFPYNMGYCQVGSNVPYDDLMNLRNILWLAPLPGNSTNTWLAPGVLVVLDAHPEGIIYQDLVPKYVDYCRTLYEDDFGVVVVDVNYLNVGVEASKFQLFIC